MRKILAAFLVAFFVWLTILFWLPPTYQTIIGYEDDDHGWLPEPIYGTKLNIRNFMLNLLPWVFFAAYLLVLSAIKTSEQK